MNYKESEYITIRQWEAMERQYGLNSMGDINTPNIVFDKTMKGFCGRKLKIKNVCSDFYEIEGIKHIFTDEMIEHNFHYGEEIEVSCDGKNWNDKRRIFVGYCDYSITPFTCVFSPDEQNFKHKERFVIDNWSYARKIEQPQTVELTLDEVAKKFGVDVNNLKIKK